MNRYLLIIFLVLLSLSGWCQRRVITVAQDGSGDFRRVQEALTSVPSPNTKPITIRIKRGVYK
uniref:pectinesterase family protein n=1 Tax=Siphonobacter sp. TaxID=1869184 RepID=UPI003B3AEA66